MSRVARVVAIAILLTFAGGGCALWRTPNPAPVVEPGRDTAREAVKVSLAASALAYDATMTALGELYRMGYLGEDARTRSIAAAELYLGAVAALRLYVDGQGALDWSAFERLRAAIETLTGLIAEGRAK